MLTGHSNSGICSICHSVPLLIIDGVDVPQAQWVGFALAEPPILAVLLPIGPHLVQPVSASGLGDRR